jgi:hypothetical protein
MRELRSASIVANEVGMLRASMRGPIVLVEGDTDTRLYRKFMLPTPHVRLTHCDGKPTLNAAMGLVASRGIPCVLGICDADFDRLLGRTAPQSISWTDFHDAEMMIVYSDAFRHVCEELYGHSLNDQAFQAARDHLIEVAAHIGSVRLWNEENNGRLRFRSVEPGQFLDSDGFSANDYLARLLEVSADSSINLDQLSIVYADARTAIGLGELATGHDFSSLLDKDSAVKSDRAPYGAEAVEKMLRLSFDVRSFAATRLLSDLRAWERAQDADLLDDSLVE